MNQADQREAGRPAAKVSPAGPIPAQPSIILRNAARELPEDRTIIAIVTSGKG
jgi:hypothetical protein